MRPRSAYAVLLSVVVILGVTACAPTKPPVSRDEAQEIIVKLVDDTVESLPVGGWELVQSPYEQDCGINGGMVWYTYGKKGGVGVDPEADAKAVAALWKERGLKVAISKNGVGEPLVEGADETGRGVEFLANQTGYAVDGTSPCVP